MKHTNVYKYGPSQWYGTGWSDDMAHQFEASAESEDAVRRALYRQEAARENHGDALGAPEDASRPERGPTMSAGYQPWNVRYETKAMLQGATHAEDVIEEAETIVFAHYERVRDLYDEPTIDEGLMRRVMAGEAVLPRACPFEIT